MNTVSTISVDATPLSSDQASLRRMQWRCRRGMRELDQLLEPTNYLGLAREWVERAVAEHEKFSASGVGARLAREER